MKMHSMFMAAALALTAIVPTQAAEVEWKMTAAIGEGSLFYKNFMERFASNVDTLTVGRVKVQPFGGGVLAPAFKAYEAVQDGIVEAGHSTPSYLVNQDPTNAIFCQLPWWHVGRGNASLGL